MWNRLRGYWEQNRRQRTGSEDVKKALRILSLRAEGCAASFRD